MRALPLAFGLLIFVAAAPSALAQPPSDPAPVPAVVERARAAFTRGNELAKREEWAEALASFRSSFELLPHPVTAFNMATCERVLGHYTRSRELFMRALGTEAKGPAPATDVLPDALAAEARGYLDEIDRLLAHVQVTLSPRDARISVDGRPLAAARAEPPSLVAGVRAPGPGEAAPAERFELLVDPGPRVVVVSRAGFRDVVRTVSLAPGSRTELALELASLPATLRIAANVERPVVTVDGVDVGLAPVQLSRPAGTYRVVVRKPGYVAHETRVVVLAGEEARVDARLSVEPPPLTKRWWFWLSAGAVVLGGATLTYLLTRTDPQPPPYDGGSTGWVVFPSRP